MHNKRIGSYATDNARNGEKYEPVDTTIHRKDVPSNVFRKYQVRTISFVRD